METINQASSALKNTIWGTGSNETSGPHREVHKSMIDDHVTETRFNGRTESDPDAEGSYQPPSHDTTRKPAGPISTGGQPQGTNLTGDLENTRGAFSNSNEPNTGFGGSGAGAQPSVGADPRSGQGIIEKHQGSGKPAADPEDSSTFSGHSSSSTDSNSSGVQPIVGGMKLPDSENQTKGEGTGTLYEKSTGMACEGGDFDATRPGAGREAARLLEEKGITRDDSRPIPEEKEKKWYGVDHSGFGGHGSHSNKRPSVSDPSDQNDTTTNTREHHDTVDTTEGTEKKGLSQKIKEKLHVSH